MSPEELNRRIIKTDNQIAAGEKSVTEIQHMLKDVRDKIGLEGTQEAPHSIIVAAERNSDLKRRVIDLRSKAAGDIIDTETDPLIRLKSEIQQLNADINQLIVKKRVTESEFFERIKSTGLSQEDKSKIEKEMLGEISEAISSKSNKRDKLRRDLRSLVRRQEKQSVKGGQ